MKIEAYKSFERGFRELPEAIKRKTEKQLAQLVQDFQHPSLRTKKIKGKEGIWEARIDLRYRMTFEIRQETIFLRVVGNHDEVPRNP